MEDYMFLHCQLNQQQTLFYTCFFSSHVHSKTLLPPSLPTHPPIEREQVVGLEADDVVVVAEVTGGGRQPEEVASGKGDSLHLEARLPRLRAVDPHPHLRGV